MHQEQGPLKKLVQKLLQVGRRNARLATAVALHLSRLFLDCPAVALLYSDDLLKLMLSDSKDPQFTAEVSSCLLTASGVQQPFAATLRLPIPVSQTP